MIFFKTSSTLTCLYFFDTVVKASHLLSLSTLFILMPSFMFFGIFFYCGAEASMFGRIPSILSENANIAPSTGNIVLIIALFIGRFLGGIVLIRSYHVPVTQFLYMETMPYMKLLIGSCLLFVLVYIISLYRAFKKEGKNPFSLDSKEPNGKLREYMMGENRFAGLVRTFPENAEKLFAEAEAQCAERYANYQKLAENG